MAELIDDVVPGVDRSVVLLYGTKPHRLLHSIILKIAHLLECIHENFCSLLVELFVKGHRLVLREIVFLNVEILNFARSREDHFTEELLEAVVVDEVHPDSESLEFALLVLFNSGMNVLQTFRSDSVVANIKKFDRLVHLQKFPQSSCTSDVNRIFEEIQTFQGSILLKSL